MKRTVPGRVRGMWTQRLLTLLAAAALTLAVAACAGGQGTSDTATSADATGETEQTEQVEQVVPVDAAMVDDALGAGIRLGVESDYELYTAEGMDLATWDAEVEKAREEGLADAISAGDIMEADGDAVIDDQDGQVFHIGRSALFGKVEGALDAYRLAYRLMEAIGGSDQTSLQLLARITKNDMCVYNFQQVANGKEVRGSTVKIAVGGDGEVTAVFANVDAEAKDDKGIVSQREAEAEAKRHAEGEKVLPELTQRVLLTFTPFADSLDLAVDAEPEPLDVAWIVYTTNEGGKDAKDRPYVAHQVKADGSYLKGLSVSEPGDVEALSGFRRQDVFEGMEAATYSCDVERQDGKVVSVTVPVMHDAVGDCYYLGDVDRRIVVADFYEAAYGDHAVHPLRSKGNDDWDVEDVYTYYNYLRAWDLYAAMGWVGPDGRGTDQVILSGLCYRDRKVFENACYMGSSDTWQVFGYAPYASTGDPLRLGWGLDVMAHEYTHCFTTAVMGQNIYKNDYGAINESMSDIMGNLCEYVFEDTDDTAWMLGENTGAPIRNMSNPGSMGQPAYVWDEHYGPHVSETTTANDNGGVHANSSLLNLVAADLCINHGMSYKEAIDLWTTVSMGLTAKTDYRQQPALLAWALGQTGLEGKYLLAVEELVDQTRIYTYEKPEPIPEDQRLVTLELPDTEAFETHDWALYAYQVDASRLTSLIRDAIALITQAMDEPDGLDRLGESVEGLLDSLHLDMSEFESPELVMDEDDRDDALSKIFRQLLGWAADRVSVQALASWEEMDTHVIPVIVDANKPTVYMLAKVSHGGAQVDTIVLKLGDTWYDMGGIVATDDAKGVDAADEEKVKTMAWSIAQELLSNLSALFDGTGEAAADTTTSKVEKLPTAGLEEVRLVADATPEAATE